MAQKRTLEELPTAQAQKAAYVIARLKHPSLVPIYVSKSLGVAPNQIWRWTRGGIVPSDAWIDRLLEFFDQLDDALRKDRPRRPLIERKNQPREGV